MFLFLNGPPCTTYAMAPSVPSESSQPVIHMGDHSICCEPKWAALQASACKLMSAACDRVIRQSGLSEPCVCITG